VIVPLQFSNYALFCAAVPESWLCADQHERAWSECLTDAGQAISAEPNIEERFDRVLLAQCAEMTEPEQRIDPGTGDVESVRNDGGNKNPYACLELACQPGGRA